jgi:hypothetical protein
LNFELSGIAGGLQVYHLGQSQVEVSTQCPARTRLAIAGPNLNLGKFDYANKST